ncbi:MAG: acylhydrolase [Rikenellaceae bacterium]|nr:acylhydrolase [Rikenellaceae bacterium]
MKKFLMFLCALVLVAGATTAQTADKKKAPKDWAKFGYYEKANAEIADRVGKIDAVFMGNSITRGWVRQDAAFFDNNNFVGRGIGGQTTSEMLVRFRQDVLDLKPRCVVIMAGINDIAMNNGIISLDNIMGNIRSMCELAKAHKIKVILCSVTPSRQFRWRKELTPAEDIKRLNEMIREYASKNKIYYVDYHSALTEEDGGMPLKWAKDGVHPNKACYITVMEPMVLAAVNKVLKTKKNYISPLE